MESYCQYHPLEPSEWYCKNCQVHFCEHCVAMPPGSYNAQCPVCHQNLGHSGSTAKVPPFWQCLSDFFAYPISRDPIVLIAICTLLPAIFNQGFLALIILIVLVCAQTKYMYLVIEQSARGDLKPPTLKEAFMGGGLMLVIQQTLIFIIFGGLVFAANMWLGSGIAMLLLILILIGLPASIMLLATEHEITQALDPSRILGVVGAIGWPYFVMCGYLILLMLGLGAVQEFVVTRFNPSLAYTITGFTSSYFMLVIFCMMGYVLYQYQPRLGGAIHSSQHEVHKPDLAQKNEKQSLIEIDIALKDGRYDLAIESLTNLFSRKPYDKVTLDRLFKLLMLTGRWDVLDKKSLPVLKLLVETGRIREIRQMLRGLYSKREKFEVRDPEAAYHIAQSLYHAGDYRLLLRVLQGYGQRFKDAPHQAEVIMLSARALANGLHNGPKAKQYLMYLAKNFSQDDLAAQVPELLEHLKKDGRLPDPKVSFG
ncbi:B-box zinc finger protein [Hahella sp. CCB-MM4]|uniref:B-box zinc finger protein n=1 Tax=Hahella sp. (strain CCB-MM4) TaxID=1926491 RepID=UPI001FEE2C25|nr:B-box zinc finger protein [Hahella sp. CCB-MM4]